MRNGHISHMNDFAGLDPAFNMPEDWKSELTTAASSQAYDTGQGGGWVAVRSQTFELACGADCAENYTPTKAPDEGVDRDHVVEHLARIGEPVERYVAQCAECGEVTQISEPRGDT